MSHGRVSHWYNLDWSWIKYYKGLFTLDSRTKFNVHWSHSQFCLGQCELNVHSTRSTFGSGSGLNSLFIHQITTQLHPHKEQHLIGSIVKAFVSMPPYMLYSPSKIPTTMACYAGMQLTRCCWKRDRLPSGLVYFIEIHGPRRLLPMTRYGR